MIESFIENIRLVYYKYKEIFEVILYSIAVGFPMFLFYWLYKKIAKIFNIYNSYNFWFPCLFIFK